MAHLIPLRAEEFDPSEMMKYLSFLFKENKYQDEINKFYDTSSEFNPALEPYVGNNNVDKTSVKLYNYGMDLAKELNEMLSQMEDQTNSKIYKISKPRYSLNDFWTNLDHGHDNLDLIKRADLSKVVMDWVTELG